MQCRGNYELAVLYYGQFKLYILWRDQTKVISILHPLLEHPRQTSCTRKRAPQQRAIRTAYTVAIRNLYNMIISCQIQWSSWSSYETPVVFLPNTDNIVPVHSRLPIVFFKNKIILNTVPGVSDLVFQTGSVSAQSNHAIQQPKTQGGERLQKPTDAKCVAFIRFDVKTLLHLLLKVYSRETSGLHSIIW